MFAQDAGQEKFGAEQCEVCGMVYTPSDASDEATHRKFHQHSVNALKFPVSSCKLYKSQMKLQIKLHKIFLLMVL
jgi:methionyl-tRNA synthetase